MVVPGPWECKAEHDSLCSPLHMFAVFPNQIASSPLTPTRITLRQCQVPSTNDSVINMTRYGLVDGYEQITEKQL